MDNGWNWKIAVEGVDCWSYARQQSADGGVQMTLFDVKDALFEYDAGFVRPTVRLEEATEGVVASIFTELAQHLPIT